MITSKNKPLNHNYFVLDFTGYSCRWVGNLECQAFKFQCDGSGIVDCTGDCPGGEDGH